jgi:hypothetical protein
MSAAFNGLEIVALGRRYVSQAGSASDNVDYDGGQLRAHKV